MTRKALHPGRDQAWGTAAVGYEGVRGLALMDALTQTNYEKHALGAHHIQEAQEMLVTASRNVRNVILDAVVNDQRALEGRIQEAKRYRAEFFRNLEQVKGGLILEVQRARAAEIEKAFKEWDDKAAQVMELARQNKPKEAPAGLAALDAVADPLERAMAKFSETKIEVMRQAQEQADATYRSTRALLIGLAALAAVLAVGIGLAIARMIARPLGKAVEGMRAALREVSLAAEHAATASQQGHEAADHEGHNRAGRPAWLPTPSSSGISRMSSRPPCSAGSSPGRSASR